MQGIALALIRPCGKPHRGRSCLTYLIVQPEFPQSLLRGHAGVPNPDLARKQVKMNPTTANSAQAIGENSLVAPSRVATKIS
jgi:hypothetical protein